MTQRWSILDSMGRFVMEIPEEDVVREDYIPPYPNWCKDHPGSMPGNGAVYSGGIKAANEWVRGTWAYDPPVSDDPIKVEQRMRDFVASMSK